MPNLPVVTNKAAVYTIVNFADYDLETTRSSVGSKRKFAQGWQSGPMDKSELIRCLIMGNGSHFLPLIFLPADALRALVLTFRHGPIPMNRVPAERRAAAQKPESRHRVTSID